MPETRFDVRNMKCGGCVAKVQEALRTVPGAGEAVVDLASHTAVVKGNFDPNVVVRTLTRIGYPASVKP